MFFKKKPKIAFPILVFIGDEGKKHHIVSRAKSNDNLAFVYFFENTKEAITNSLKENWIDYSESVGDLGIKLVPADQVSSLQASTKVQIVELHPLLSKNNQLAQECNGIIEHGLISMTEPVMEIFGSERIIQLMSNMGANPLEAFNHKLIEKSVSRALEKITHTTPTPTEVKTSQAEWLKANPLR